MILKKHSISKPVSKAAKSLEKTTPMLPKNTKSRPSILKKTILSKTKCLQYFPLRKSCFRTSSCQDFDLNINAKNDTQARKQYEIQPSRAHFFMGPKTSRNHKILVPGSTCLSCCCHGPPRCPQAATMAPRVPKWRHQAHRMIGLGVSKVTAMSKKCQENWPPEANLPPHINKNQEIQKKQVNSAKQLS